MEIFTQKLEAEIRAKINPAYAGIRGDESWERKMLLDEIDRLRLISKEYYSACDEAARTASRYRRALAEAHICLKQITEPLENPEELPKAAASEISAGLGAGDRQSGKTTRQMQDAPSGAVFVWCNQHIIYAKNLAKYIGRNDLQIVAPSWLENNLLNGRRLTGLVVDHAANLSETQQDGFKNACLRIYA